MNVNDKRISGLAIVTILFGQFACTPISRREGVFQPKTPGYTYADGVVSHNGKPEIRVVQTNVDVTTTHYEVKSADGATQASVTFGSSYGGTLDVRADFAKINRHYEARIPIVPFTDQLASYIDNRVLVDGKLSEEGLQAYAASRGIKLIDTSAQIGRFIEHGKKERCKQCVEDFRACQVDASYARKHPRPGVTFSTSCSSKFQACSQGGILTRQSEWPCGPSPE